MREWEGLFHFALVHNVAADSVKIRDYKTTCITSPLVPLIVSINSYLRQNSQLLLLLLLYIWPYYRTRRIFWTQQQRTNAVRVGSIRKLKFSDSGNCGIFGFRKMWNFRIPEILSFWIPENIVLSDSWKFGIFGFRKIFSGFWKFKKFWILKIQYFWDLPNAERSSKRVFHDNFQECASIHQTIYLNISFGIDFENCSSWLSYIGRACEV